MNLNEVFNVAQMAGYSVQEHCDIYRMVLAEDYKIDAEQKKKIQAYVSAQKQFIAKWPSLADVKPVFPIPQNGKSVTPEMKVL